MPQILGVRIDAVTQKAACERCQTWLTRCGDATRPHLVFTPNPEILVYAARQPEFKKVLAQADLTVPDGIGIVWLAKPRLPERVTGTDLMIELLNFIEQTGLTVGFVLNKLGLSNKEGLAKAVQQRWPKLKYQIIYPEEIFTPTSNLVLPELICVALGCPEQEQWCIQQSKGALAGARLFLTVGGGVDFLTGQLQRAPSFFRKLGLEWLWRLLMQPKRWRRILTAVIIFPWYVWTRAK